MFLTLSLSNAVKTAHIVYFSRAPCAVTPALTWPNRVSACEESRPAGSAERCSSYVLGKFHPFQGQSINVRRPAGRDNNNITQSRYVCEKDIYSPGLQIYGSLFTLWNKNTDFWLHLTIQFVCHKMYFCVYNVTIQTCFPQNLEGKKVTQELWDKNMQLS